MHLTRYADNALRVLIYLATDPDRTVTISQIAARFDVSHNHLMKVVHHLARHGLIVTRRGKGGGLQLGCRTEEVSVGRVVRIMEPSLEIIDCWTPPCPIRGYCRLKTTVMEAREAFLAVLDRYTVKDLVANRQTLVHLLEQTG